MSKGTLKMSDESEVAAQIREAIGVGPTESVEVVTPQFEREPGAPAPAAPPTDWYALREMDLTALRELGCRAWNDPSEIDDEFGGQVLMLFPGEWYWVIPAGFVVTSIFNRDEAFVPGRTDDDTRFGCLSFGVKVRS